MVKNRKMEPVPFIPDADKFKEYLEKDKQAE